MYNAYVSHGTRKRTGQTERMHGLGAVRQAVPLVVRVYLEEHPNGEEVIRIVSAREADQRERRIYQGTNP